MNIFFHLLSIISLSFGAGYFHPDLHLRSKQQTGTESFSIPTTLKLVGIMAQFPIENPDNPRTSGNGHFLSGEVEDYIKFFDSEVSRCEGFLVDRPPHNSSYFQKQLEAVGNYYKHISNGEIPVEIQMILNTDPESNGYYQVSKKNGILC